jgi:hypothetical protein
MTAIHRQSGSGRWHEMSLVEQLGNVGSEVDRSIRAWEGGNTARFNSAVDRALELFDLTAADDRWRGHRRREILRAREQFCALFWGDAPVWSASGLSRYFLHFATVARRTRSTASPRNGF